MGKLGDAESAVKRSFIPERIFYRKISADNLCCFFIGGTVLRKLRKKLLWLGKALVDNRIMISGAYTSAYSPFSSCM